MRTSTVILLCLFFGTLAKPAAAQSGSHWYDAPADVPQITLRPFLDVSAEAFTASRTFDAVFGSRSAPFWGGGLQVVAGHGRFYGEVGASRLLKKNGQLVGTRAFVTDGVAYQLGIPLRATIRPIEVVGGYRFNVSPRLVPYVGAGAGHYHYTEQSDFADASENVDVSHVGAIFQAGAEIRVHRWIGVAADAHYTHVPDILGVNGVSQQFAVQAGSNAAREKDLGGWAVRLKVVVGR
jgi:Outer membrane protein beta-barrel domain